jgi:hypothetical protein
MVTGTAQKPVSQILELVERGVADAKLAKMGQKSAEISQFQLAKSHSCRRDNGKLRSGDFVLILNVRKQVPITVERDCDGAVAHVGLYSFRA